MQTGYRYAAENGYDIAIQMDGDGQHNAEYIPDLIALIEKERRIWLLDHVLSIKKDFRHRVCAAQVSIF